MEGSTTSIVTIFLCWDNENGNNVFSVTSLGKGLKKYCAFSLLYCTSLRSACFLVSVCFCEYMLCVCFLCLFL